MTPREQSVIELIRRYQLVSDAEVTSAEFEVKRNPKKTVISVLLDNGLLSKDQIRRIDTRQQKIRPACFKCLRLAKFDRTKFKGEYTCPFCGAACSLKDGTCGQVEQLLPNPPDRAVDKIVEQLIVKKIDKAKLVELKQQRKKTTPRPTLLEQLTAEKLAPPAAVARLSGKANAIVRRKVEHWNELRDDFQLAKFLCMLGLVGHRDLTETLQHQFEEAFKRGNYVPLRKALQDKGKLTPFQVRWTLVERFDDRKVRNEIFEAIEAERSIEEDPFDEMDNSWDDSVDAILMESRELMIDLADDEDDHD